MNKHIQVIIQVSIILAIGVGFVWLTSSFSKPKPQEEIIKEVVEEIIRKKPTCPNTFDYFNELKNTGQIVELVKDFDSYGVDGRFTNVRHTIVKSSSSGSQIACGYLFIRAQSGGQPLQQEWQHPYIRPGQFGGHLSLKDTMEKEKLEEKEFGLITTEGKEIIVSYKIDIDGDDYILKAVRRGLEDNEIYFEDWADFEITFNGKIIMELDMRKIIGIRW